MQMTNYFCTALLLLALLVFAVPRSHAGHADGATRAPAETPLLFRRPVGAHLGPNHAKPAA